MAATRTISVFAFKAKCLTILDQVDRHELAGITGRASPGRDTLSQALRHPTNPSTLSATSIPATGESLPRPKPHTSEPSRVAPRELAPDPSQGLEARTFPNRSNGPTHEAAGEPDPRRPGDRA